MFSGFPHVEIPAEERERERKTEAAQRLGERDDVRLDALLAVDRLEREERTRAAASHLDVVDDHQDAALARDASKPAEPLALRDVDAPLGLNGLHDDGGGEVEAAALVDDQALEELEGVDAAVHVAVEGHRGRMREGEAGSRALLGVPGHCEGAERHSVEAVGEAHDP